MAAGDVVMGRVVTSYGVHGWLKVLPYTAEKDTLLGYQQWSLTDREGVTRAYSLKEGRIHGEHLVVALEGVAVREAAAVLSGMLISVPRATLPKPAKGEFYFVDLVGLKVINRDGDTLGTVTAVQDYGAQPVLHIAQAITSVAPAKDGTGGKVPEILIPFVGAYIDGVELEAGCIRVDWWRE